MTFGLQLFQFILSGLTTGSTYTLIAIGFSLIHNATGIVNFAQGEFVMLGGMFMITYYSFLKLPMLPAFFLTIFSVSLIGLLLERGPIRQAKSKEILLLVMITVGASISIKGLSMILWGKNPMTLPAFSGEAPIGKNKIELFIWVEGPPDEKRGGARPKSNTAPEKYWGPKTALEEEVSASGPNEFKFELSSR